MEKKKFYPRKICIFVLQLHRVAFCLDELECAPVGQEVHRFKFTF